MEMDRLPLVSISCTTYNHITFIRECLDGFLMQKTTFPFEIVIHDDASVDGTKEIVEEYSKKYPDIIFPMYQKENQYSNGIRGMMVRYNFPRCRGKYIALCEGDDYWSDPFKLQKQVDLLEGNANLSGAFHETKQIFNDGKETGLIYGVNTSNIIQPEDTMSNWSIFHTSSFIFRSNFTKNIPDWYFTVVSADMALFSIISKYGNIGKIDDVMSVYRKHEGGITNSTLVMSDFHKERIKLMNLLNEFHQFKYTKKVDEVIQFHRNKIMLSDGLGKTGNNLLGRIKNKFQHIFRIKQDSG